MAAVALLPCYLCASVVSARTTTPIASAAASSSSSTSSTSTSSSVASRRPKQQSWRCGGAGKLLRQEKVEEEEGVRWPVGMGRRRRRREMTMAWGRRGAGVARGMAPDEEKMTRRSPLDFPLVSLYGGGFLLEP